MADKIDKSLPNVKETIHVESPEETEIEETQKLQEINDEGVEVTQNEDGSADIDFEPGKASPAGSDDHFTNLADLLPEEVINRLASELYQNYEDYKNSRKDWEQTYTQGLDLLGFKYVNRSQPFQGASGATHPVLAEAVTQFQATAYKELLPSDGPVRTQILGMATPEKEDPDKGR